MVKDTKDYGDYEMYTHEKEQTKIDNYQQGLIDQILKIMHDAQERLMDRDYEDFLVLVRDLIDEKEKENEVEMKYERDEESKYNMNMYYYELEESWK